jgi:hypothetical protein
VADLPATKPSKPPPILPAALVLLLAASLIGGCHPRPANVPHALDSAAVAYSGAVVALELADQATTAWIDSLEDPTDAQLDDAERVVEALILTRASLAVVRQGLIDGRDVLDSLTAAARSLRALCDDLDRLGVPVPPRAAEALDGALEVLQ